MTNRGNDLIELYLVVFRQIPQIVEVSRLVSSWIGERDRFFGGNFVERVDENGPVFWKVGELRVSAKHRPVFERERQHLIDGDIDLHVVAHRERPGVAKVERVGVGADARVLAVEREDDARLLLDDRVDRFKACANRFEGERFAESEVQVFRETLVGKVASLQRRASLERKNGLQIGLRERAEEPSETVVPFEDVFANASCSAGC